MRATTTVFLALAAIGATFMSAPASADNATLSVRDTEGLPLYTSNIRDHAVNCIRSGCVDNPNGSINYQKSYEATVKAQSGPR